MCVNVWDAVRGTSGAEEFGEADRLLDFVVVN